MANGGVRLVGRVRRFAGGTAAVYQEGDRFLVSVWEEATDTYRTVEEWAFDGPAWGPDAKAARALALGGRDTVTAG